MRIGRPICYLIFGANALLVAACSGPQSALSPAGKEAERIAELFWWMTAGALLIWVAVVGIGIYTALGKSRVYSRSGATKVLIIGGGALLPTVILALTARLWPQPAAATRCAGARGESENRGLRRAVVVAGKLPPAWRRCRDSRTRE
jgi:heme/copper-type cytochrome/quinol oxidase subunit 2